MRKINIFEHIFHARVTREHAISKPHGLSVYIIISHLSGAASELPEVVTERAFKGAAERTNQSVRDILSELDVFKGKCSRSRRRRQPGQPSTPPRVPRRGQSE